MTENNSTRPGSRFASLVPATVDGPFALEAAFRQDTDSRKVNLGIGAYRDDEAKPWLLSSVKEDPPDQMPARDRMAAAPWLHEYLSLPGDDAFTEASKKLLFGTDAPSEVIASVQTVSGTGANSVIAQLMADEPAPRQIWFPDPTWDNHFRIWRHHAPGISQRKYPYYDASRRRFDFDGMMASLRRDALSGDVILLHACAHNPTGLDPTQAQWRDIASICSEKNLFVVFDVAYQGFASGDLDQDAWAVRYFSSRGDIELAACQSFSKNMGLYGERVGVLHVLPRQDHVIDPVRVWGVRSRLVEFQRVSFSMAPRFGSQLAKTIMSDGSLFSTWKEDLSIMTGRIKAMRQALYEGLITLGTPGDWTHVVEQTGMFSYTGLIAAQVDRMKTEHHVYMLSSGRISICGLTSQNVGYVARAIHHVVTATG